MKCDKSSYLLSDMSQHIQYMKSMLAIKSFTKSDLAKFQIGVTLEEAVTNSFMALQCMLTDPENNYALSGTMLQHSLDTILQLANNCERLGCNTVNVDQPIMDFFKWIIIFIMDGNSIEVSAHSFLFTFNTSTTYILQHFLFLVSYIAHGIRECGANDMFGV